MLAPWKESYDQPKQHIKKQRHYLANKGLSSQSYGFSSSHVWMWEMDHKESWASKNRCFWTVVLEKILESPLDCKEIQPVHPKGNQSWVFIGRAAVEAETPIYCEELAHLKRPWCWERSKAGGEGDDRGWDRWMASPSQWTWVWISSGIWWWTGRPGVLGSWSHKELDMTERLNWSKKKCEGLFSSLSSFLGLNCMRSLRLLCHLYGFKIFWYYIDESYCSWGSQGRNTELVYHSLLQWATFCQNSPPWPVHLGWPYMAWLIVSWS